jgi:tripartite-type tricarboxylate transporter receptor subunit TctC
MGVAAPAGTPAVLVERLNQDLAHALATDAAKEWFRSQVLGGTSADFGKRIKTDYERWGEVIRTAGIKAQ